MPMFADAVVHWLHLMAAILWVGGVLFTSLVLQPALRERLPAKERLDLYLGLGRRFSFLQWGAWATLALTGLSKLWGLRTAPEVFYGPFGRILGAKLVLVGGMAVLSLLHSALWGPRLHELGPGHPEYGALASRMVFWGGINLILLAAIVFCAALLRFNPW